MAQQLPRKDEDLKTFAIGFHSACAGNLTELGLTSAQLTDLNDKLIDFDTKLAEATASKLVTKSKLGYKDTAARTLADALRPLIRIIRGHNVPDGLLDLLGIGPIDPAHPAQPEQPVGLSVIPYANGTNWLRWKHGTNKKGTIYMIEVMNADTEGWSLVATQNKLNYRHQYQTPGFQQTYRVRAVRRGMPGIPSNQFTVYGPELNTAEVVELKAA